MKAKNKLLVLFLTMLKIGLFTFGGGYAMIGLIESELVERKKWIGKEEFLDMAAIAESTPGPIAINAATYVGYRYAGFGGSLVATFGICLPSFVIIYLISLFFDAFLELEYVSCAFRGIQIGVLYLILSAGMKMLKSMKKTAFNITVFLVVLVLMVTFTFFSVNFSTVYYILISGTLSVVLYFLSLLRDKKQEGRK